MISLAKSLKNLYSQVSRESSSKVKKSTTCPSRKSNPSEELRFVQSLWNQMFRGIFLTSFCASSAKTINSWSWEAWIKVRVIVTVTSIPVHTTPINGAGKIFWLFEFQFILAKFWRVAFFSKISAIYIIIQDRIISVINHFYDEVEASSLHCWWYSNSMCDL